MVSLTQVYKNALRLSAAALALAVPSFAAGISATADFTATPDANPGLYDYNLTLTNTGTTTIGTFWFGWVPGAGFLPTVATNVTSPAGWSDILTNTSHAIQWTTTTSLLQPGQTLTGFNFVTASSPAQLLANYTGTGAGTGDPITTSFVYIAKPLADPGLQFVATQVTPEPGSLVLLATGLLGGAGTFYRRLKMA